MESNSSCNVESGQNLKQNEDAEETKSHVNDNSIIYFDCKICQNTVSACKGQENMDPNSEQEICRNCKASQNCRILMISTIQFFEHQTVRPLSP